MKTNLKSIYFLVSLLSVFSVKTMEQQKLPTLTPQEEECMDWFDKSTEKVSAFQALSPKDLETFTKKIKFQDDPKRVKKSRTNFVKELVKFAQEKGIAFPHDEKTLLSAVIKTTQRMHSRANETPTNERQARILAHNELSEHEQRLITTPDGYLAHKQEAHQIVAKWSKLAVKLMLQHHIIDEGAPDKEQELINEKLAKLKTQFESK